MIVRCPAKINTFLAVGPKDRIGYHPLRTIFQAVSLSDELAIELAAKTEITCSWPELPENNTLTKALRLMGELIDIPPLRIHLEKQIPAQSGMGGGSSDAAGLIRGVQRLLNTELPWGQATSIAAAVGADVPFFLVGGRARGEGYGEKLTPLDDPEPYELVIARPNDHCPTPEAFQKLDARERLFRAFPEDAKELFNDFEATAPCASLEWSERLLIHGAQGALLTGSGSAVFGRFEAAQQADYAAEKLKEEGCPFVWRAVPLTRAESLELRS